MGNRKIGAMQIIACFLYFISIFMSCKNSVHNEFEGLTEIDTTKIERSVLKYLHEYMDAHKEYSSFVLIETMTFFDKDTSGYYDYLRYSTVFDITPAIDILFGHGEYGLWDNYPSSCILFEEDNKIIFKKSISDDIFDKKQMKKIYDKYAFHMPNLDALYVYGKTHQYFVVNYNTHKVELINAQDGHKLRSIVRNEKKFTPPN